jgi:hypothetical protein
MDEILFRETNTASGDYPYWVVETCVWTPEVDRELLISQIKDVLDDWRKKRLVVKPQGFDQILVRMCTLQRGSSIDRPIGIVGYISDVIREQLPQG